MSRTRHNWNQTLITIGTILPVVIVLGGADSSQKQQQRCNDGYRLRPGPGNQGAAKGVCTVRASAGARELQTLMFQNLVDGI